MVLKWLLYLMLLTVAACSPTYTTRVVDTPETRDLKGHQKPYTVNGRRYEPLRSPHGFVQEGMASWYGEQFHGKLTSNGETYDMYAMTAAHKTLPMGVYVRVTNRNNGKSTVVRVNDRGPFVDDRIIDLSYAAAKQLEVVGPGTAPVRLEALGYSPDGRDASSSAGQPQTFSISGYSVQIGAFGMRDNAERLATELRSRYGEAEVKESLVDGRRFFRVRVGNFSSLEIAEAAVATLQRDGYGKGMVVAKE